MRRSPPNRDSSIPIGPRTLHVAHTPPPHRPHAAQVFLSYLPLSHIAAMELDVMFHCATGGQIYFATPDALSGGMLLVCGGYTAKGATRDCFAWGCDTVGAAYMESLPLPSCARPG